jgi:hypothetical protein
LGFIGFPINVIEATPLQPKPELRNTCDVIDRAQATIDLGGQRYELGTEMCNLVNSIREKGYTSSGYITSNADFCGENRFETLYNQYSSNGDDYDVFFHVDNCKEGEAVLFVKVNPNYLLVLSPDNPVMSSPKDEVLEEYIESLEDNNCPGCPSWMQKIWDYSYDPIAIEGSTFGFVLPAIPIISAADGPLKYADLIAGAVAAIAIGIDALLTTHITYIAHNKTLDVYYCGRTSGKGTPNEVMNKRLLNHHQVDFDYDTRVDKALQGEIGRLCIRGREQQLIDYYGGAIRDPEVRNMHPIPNKCVNIIRGVSKINIFGYFYHWCSSTAFGEKYPYTGYQLQDIHDLIRRKKDWFDKKFK